MLTSKRLLYYIGLFLIALGAFVCLGWWIKSPGIVQVTSQLVPTQVYTAVSIIFIGLSLVFFSRWLLLLPFGLALLFLAEYLLGRDFGIDQLFTTMDFNILYPGRMALNTSVGLMILCGALFFLEDPKQSLTKIWISSILTVIALAMGFIVFFINLSEIHIYPYLNLQVMSIHTALSLLILGIGLLYYQHQALFHSYRNVLPLWKAINIALGCIIGTSVIIQSLSHLEKKYTRTIVETDLEDISKITRMTLDTIESEFNIMKEVMMSNFQWDALVTKIIKNDPQALGLQILDVKGYPIYTYNPQNNHLSDNIHFNAKQNWLQYLESENVFVLGAPLPNSYYLIQYFSMPKFLETILPPHVLKDYVVAVSIDERLVFMNDPDVDIQENYSIGTSFNFFNTKWALNFCLKDIFGDIHFIIISILLFGILLSCLLGLIYYFAQRSALEMEEVQATTQAKSSFLDNMSHEIRTPLNGILGTASLLYQTELSPKQEKLVTTINQSGHMLLEVINDVLDISKSESGAMILREELVNVKDLIQNSIDLYAPKAEEKGLTLHYTYQSDETMAYIDPIRITQIVNNFISNAIKYTEKGSVTVKGQIVANYLKVTVQDTGIGIADEKKHLLFEKFVQLENRQGSGLGLAICKILVDKMHGRIGFESERGVGSVFWFEIPLKSL